jgi:hypothetical protein
MKTQKMLAVFFVYLVAALAWSQSKPEGRMQMQVLPGQVLKLELSSGDYRIEPGASDKLVVISQTANPNPKPRFGVDANAKQASVKVDGPPNYTALIQVPRNSDLRIRLNGGRLQVSGIEGDKDIESNAGAIRIDVGRPESYRKVDASVGVGHIDARAFQAEQAGLARSFRREGPGKFRLHAHVGAGDITFFSNSI